MGYHPFWALSGRDRLMEAPYWSLASILIPPLKNGNYRAIESLFS